MRQSRFLLWLLIAAAAWGGCSKGPKLPTVAVSGTVTLDGKPLEGANVAFTPTNVLDGKPANGVTDAQGKFRLQTYLGGMGQTAGALPDDYIVVVTKYEATRGGGPPTADDLAKEAEAQQAAQKARKPIEVSGQAKLLTPVKYSNPKQTDLKATVKKESDNEFTFDLKS